MGYLTGFYTQSHFPFTPRSIFWNTHSIFGTYSESLKDNKGLSQCYFGNISVLDWPIHLSFWMWVNTDNVVSLSKFCFNSPDRSWDMTKTKSTRPLLSLSDSLYNFGQKRSKRGNFTYPSSHKFGTQENWDFRDFGKNGFSKKLGLSGFLKNGLLKKIGTYELGLYKIDF